MNKMTRNKLKKPLILFLVIVALCFLFRSDKVVFSEKEYKEFCARYKDFPVVPDYTENGKEIEIAYKIEDETIVLGIEEYKILKYDQYKDSFSNEHQKLFINEKPTLKKFPKDMERPSPYMLIRETRPIIDEISIRKELERIYNFHMQNGDDDLRKIPEIKEVLKESTSKIPNIVHFIWFGCRRYKIHQYMSMLSVLKYQNPSLILFHTNCKPNGSYWEVFERAAGSKLKIVKKSPPTSIWGNNVEKVEHQSDVARLQLMLEIGGIYLDDDVITLRSLDELRHNEMVLGEENYDAVANSVIMASKDSWFLKRWFQEYRTFNDSIWSESSCFVPWSLWQLFPGDIHVEKETMLRPNWEEVAYLYRELWDWTENFTVHLFSRFMYQVDGTDERSMMDLAILNTTYGEIARHVIWNDPGILSMQDWMLNYIL